MIDESDVRFGVILRQPTHERLRELAALKGLPLAAYARMVLIDHIHSKDEPHPTRKPPAPTSLKAVE